MTTTATTKPPFGSVEQLASVLRRNNPSESLVDGRALAVIDTLVNLGDPDATAMQHIRNALAAAEQVRAEIRQAASR